MLKVDKHKISQNVFDKMHSISDTWTGGYAPAQYNEA